MPMTLLDPSSAELATTVVADPWWPSGSLLTPAATIAPGAGHRLSYDETCTALGASAQGSRVFDVGGASALPTQIGALSGENWKVGPRAVMTSSGSCFKTIEAVTIDLRLTPSPEVMAYAPVTGFKLKIDGQSARASYYGAATKDEKGIVVFQIHAACGTRNASDDNGVTLGEHDFELTAHTAGTANDPPAVVKRLKFSCTDSTIETQGDAGTTKDEDVADASPPRGNPGTDRDPVPPKGEGPAAAGQPDTATAGCACTTAGASHSSAAGAFGMVFGIAALIGARARRRATWRGPAR